MHCRAALSSTPAVALLTVKRTHGVELAPNRPRNNRMSTAWKGLAEFADVEKSQLFLAQCCPAEIARRSNPIGEMNCRAVGFLKAAECAAVSDGKNALKNV